MEAKANDIGTSHGKYRKSRSQRRVRTNGPVKQALIEANRLEDLKRAMEDEAIIYHPHESILDKGGMIFFANCEGVNVGTVSMINMVLSIFLWRITNMKNLI